MASIRKAPERKAADGRVLPGKGYEVRYRDPAGRQRTKKVPLMADARAFVSTLEADMVRGTWVDPEHGRVLLSQWVEDWWPTTANLRPSTRARDRVYLDRYILPTLGARPIGSVAQLDVKTWVSGLTARGLAPATVVKAYQILGKLLRAAVDADMLVKTPCRSVPLPRVEREEMRFLSPAEASRLADTIDARYRALVLVGAYGGLRIGELAGLRRQRVDLLAGTVDVAEIVVEVGGHLTMGPPKTRAGRRIVGLPRPVVEELAAHLAAHTSERVFPAPEGGPLRVPAWRRRAWAPAVLAAGLAPLRPHDLRHTAVALWIAAGAGPKQVAVRAGHTSVAFTLDRYGHLFPEADEQLRAGLEAMFEAGARSAGGGAVMPLRRA